MPKAATEAAKRKSEGASVHDLFVSAMGVLMSFQRRMTLQEGKVRVVVPPSRVRDALEIARLHTVLNIYDTLDAALKARAG